MAQFNSDGRILSLLRSGEDMRMHVDPDGILGSGVTGCFGYSLGEGNDNWYLQVVFPSGDSLQLTGVASENSVLFVSGAELVSGSERLWIPLKGAETLLEAFGNLSELPVPMKRNLAALPSRNANLGHLDFDCRAFFELARDALFYGVEGGESSEGLRNKFNNITVRYSSTLNGDTCSAAMSSNLRLDEGRIIVSSGVDIYGLNEKKVVLKYNLGMGHHISSDCFLTIDRKTVPSLKLALALASQLDGIFTKQRRKKTSKGKPKAK